MTAMVIKMAVNFDDIDKNLDLKAIDEQVKQAKENSVEVPKGTYICSVEKMEIGTTKDGRPMFKLQCRIKEGSQKNRCLFMNRVIYGTKNDGSMIQSVQTVLAKFTENVPQFTGYNDFADAVCDLYEDVQGKTEVEVDYDEKAFNSISIKEVYDL